ncbi:MAG: PqqD family protein [Candidatus Neomarinimicrobiota bacterium]|nr:MAG: PqqD family protein [Candidatus Neomarinimicrobiota bacterium]
MGSKRESNKGRGRMVDLRTVIPRPLVSHEIGKDGRVILLKPKFNSSFFKKYIMSRMKRPFYRIYLDEIGSAVWMKIDGRKCAATIADELYEEFKEKVEPRYERLWIFLVSMKRGKLVEF